MSTYKDYQSLVSEISSLRDEKRDAIRSGFMGTAEYLNRRIVEKEKKLSGMKNLHPHGTFPPVKGQP